MGVYDCIIFNCPNCDNELVAQSKSGMCTLEEHDYKNVPVTVSIDANRHAPFLCECGKMWKFRVIPVIEQRISLELEEVI